jgi:hypothetical protein
MKQHRGEQIVYSVNNYNLFLDEWDFLENTFTISKFLLLIDGHRDNILLPAPITHCRKCSEDNKVPCLLLMNSLRKLPVKTNDYSYEERIKTLVITEEQLDNAICSCSKLNWLISQTDTKYEKWFVMNYLRWALSCVLFHPFFSTTTATEMVSNAIKDYGEATELGAKEVGDDKWNFWLRTQFLKKLVVPILIPQVVINHISAQKLPPGHPDRLFFKENASRVDFIMLREGNKHVIEIDGFSHFTDESAYVRNLVIGRSLRKDGWSVHRFGNLEVREKADNIDFILDEINIFDFPLS